MDFQEVVQKVKEKSFEQGNLILNKNENINEIVKKENVPNKYGVYVIYSVKNGQKEVIYIGKSGTLCSNGFRKQGIKKRLTMKQRKMSRKEFFQKVISENDYDSLYFEWYVTYENGKGILPFLMESELLAAYFYTYRKLPKLNRCI
ncbi:hypothetical protein [Nitrosophilus kaiyonis]|uniref:hypothetical protein n=1 Tax=Nitrosophilus kaiyonis TaxID=2930200 RepID=UPI0024929A72|nr:hypothetical protein [Nitrosophilus kaiyonis]